MWRERLQVAVVGRVEICTRQTGVLKPGPQLMADIPGGTVCERQDANSPAILGILAHLVNIFTR